MTTHFYRTDIPARNDVVIADVKSIRDDAVYCTLPAYGDMEVMLPTSEINVKRHKKVTDYVREGDQVAVTVLRDEGRRLDVSMKQVRESESEEAFKQFHRDARVHLVVRSAAGQDAAATMALYRDVVWPQVEAAVEAEQVTDAYAYFQEFLIDPTAAEKIPASLMEAIQQRIPMPVHTVEEEVMIRQGTFHDGAARVVAILNDLAAREKIKVYVVAPPKYRIVATDNTKERATARLAAAMRQIPEVC